MSTETAFLPLLLDGPLQSWGASSRFQRRMTGLYPSKSGVIGMICAAMGLAKGSQHEAEILPRLCDLIMTVFVIPRRVATPWGSAPVPVRRMDDFHTVGGGYDKKTAPQYIPRQASSGKPCDDATITHRQYLIDARFGVLLQGDRQSLERAAAAIRDPVWGVWLGRKCCIPATPLLPPPGDGAVFADRSHAFVALLQASYRASGLKAPELLPEETAFDCVVEGEGFGEMITDVPVSFGDGKSSGPDKREFAARSVRVRAGVPGLPHDGVKNHADLRTPTP